MNARTPAERTLAAETRAVEEGHIARFSADRMWFLVKSDTLPDVSYRVRVTGVGETLVFDCDCPTYRGSKDHRRSFVPDKHGALVARRLEREGLLRWSEGRWVPSEKAYRLGVTERPVADPFEGLGA